VEGINNLLGRLDALDIASRRWPSEQRGCARPPTCVRVFRPLPRMRARGARSRHPHAGSPRTGSTARGGPTCAIGGSLMCSDARIDTSGATDLSIRATRSSTFCHGAVPQDAADEGFIIGSGPIIIGHAAEFDAGSRAWAWEPYIESVLARQRQVPNDLAPVTTSV